MNDETRQKKVSKPLDNRANVQRITILLNNKMGDCVVLNRSQAIAIIGELAEALGDREFRSYEIEI